MEKAKICRYFQNGHCKMKSQCPFVHKKEFKKICKFFKQGLCKKGDDCDFYHQIQNVGPKYQAINQKNNNIKANQRVLKNREQKVIIVEQKKQLKKEQIQKQEIKIQEKQKQIKIDKLLKQEQQVKKKQLQKINIIDSILGLKPPISKKQQLKKIQEPQVNYLKKILVSFIDLIKTPEGKQNIERINKQIFEGKPYLEYLKSLTDPKLQLIAQVIRKYQYSFRFLNEEKNIFLIRISPLLDNKEMKLNFDIREKWLQLQISNMNKIKLINKSIPEYFREQINRKFQIIKQKRNIYQTLKYIQNNFQLICEQVDFILENKKFNEKDLAFEFDGGFQELQKKQSLKIIAQQTKKIEQPQQQKEVIPQVQLNTTIFLQTLETNAESLLAEEILLHLTCQCQAMITYILKAKKKKMLVIKSKIKCSKCKQIIVIYFKRQIMHKDALEIVGHIGCVGAKIQDAGALLWKINCVCENIIISTQLSLSGIKKIIKCFDCFKQYFIQYFGIFKESPYGNDQKPNKLKLQNKNKQGLFKLDTQLPNKGICKHAKFSFRYFRFPCCGRAFPCQYCHQQKTDRHDYQRAAIMICGYCSCQQMLTDTCKRCRKQLVKGAEKSGHWQGGKGCRDQALLSRNDAKKYVGLNKTVPNKK